MVKFYNSLQFRITASFVILVLLIASLTYVYTYRESRRALKETVREELAELVQAAAASLTSADVDRLVALKPGEDGSETYAEAVRQLYRLRAHKGDVANYYVMTRSGEKINFLLDDLKQDRPDDAAKIGEEYQDYDPELLAAFEKTSVSKEFYTDKWGTFLSGYAPLRNTAGAVVAVLGADMKVTRVKEKMDFIGSLIYVIIGVAVAAAGLLVLFFSMTINREIKALTAVARRVSEGHLDIQLPVIKTRNEIWELNEGLKSVVAAVEFMVDSAHGSQGGGKAE